jgi:hypothetical protein
VHVGVVVENDPPSAGTVAGALAVDIAGGALTMRSGLPRAGGRQSRTGSARLRNIVDQTFAAVGTTPPWLEHVDALWQVWELPDESPDTSGQGFAARV